MTKNLRAILSIALSLNPARASQQRHDALNALSVTADFLGFWQTTTDMTGKAKPALKIALCDGLPSDALLASLCKILGQRAIRFTLADVDQPSMPTLWGEVDRDGSKTPAYILQYVDRVGYGEMEQDERLLSIQTFIRNEEFTLGLRDFA